jgi:hypothetical protein
MGIKVIDNGNIVMIGNFAKIRKGRPKNNFDEEYKAIVPFEFKWRAKLGKVECDCTEVLECYQPYYGFSFYHLDECAIMKHYKKYPQMANFIGSPRLIAQSE